MAWKIEFDPDALKELSRIDNQTQLRIVKFLRMRIAGRSDPRKLGKLLHGDKAGLWRFRVGNYRLICHIENKTRRILVLRIGHRRDIYE
ncbi:MAG: type II toxin-antitoxin system RelE/ParE family toxin [Nitrospinota bacterium]